MNLSFSVKGKCRKQHTANKWRSRRKLCSKWLCSVVQPPRGLDDTELPVLCYSSGKWWAWCADFNFLWPGDEELHHWTREVSGLVWVCDGVLLKKVWRYQICKDWLIWCQEIKYEMLECWKGQQNWFIFALNIPKSIRQGLREDDLSES